MKLSVVIPVYNEKRTLEELLWRVARVPIPKQIIVVDDASTDGTRERLQGLQEEFQLRGARALGLTSEETAPSQSEETAGARSEETAPAQSEAAPAQSEETAPAQWEATASLEMVFHYQVENRGKGAAVRTGFTHVSGDVAIVQDADLEYDPADYPALIAPIAEGRADVVYGSRLASGALRRGYLGNYLANRFLTRLSNLFTGWRLTDMETGYKVMRGDIARSLRLSSDRFGFDPEITAKLARAGYRMVEVPVSYSGRTYEQGKKIRWRDGFVVMRAILRYAFRD